MHHKAFQRCTQSTVATAVCFITLLPAGCFSMSAVTPPASLAQVEKPNAHASSVFDASRSAILESDWGKDGKFILLHPTINEKDVGWFIFDTGASGCTITADAAERAGLPAIGSTRLPGPTRTTVYHCDTLSIGPLTLTDLNMTGLNMSRSSGAFGRKVVGILGRNLCSSAIIELDGPGRVVRLHDPKGESKTNEIISHSIEMRKNLPHVRCRYGESGEGLFVIDTGADATVHFLGFAVERHKLTESSGVRITGAKTQITFGSMGRIKEGTIDSFRIGEQQFGPLKATFGRPGDGPSKVLPDVDGLVGMGLMRTCTVYLNEPTGRVGFIRDESTRRVMDENRKNE